MKAVEKFTKFTKFTPFAPFKLNHMSAQPEPEDLLSVESVKLEMSVLSIRGTQSILCFPLVDISFAIFNNERCVLSDIRTLVLRTLVNDNDAAFDDYAFQKPQRGAETNHVWRVVSMPPYEAGGLSSSAINCIIIIIINLSNFRSIPPIPPENGGVPAA